MNLLHLNKGGAETLKLKGTPFFSARSFIGKYVVSVQTVPLHLFTLFNFFFILPKLLLRLAFCDITTLHTYL